MADAEVTVIGAGVVGLAIAARLTPKYPDLIVLEKNPRHGLETSSRNSEVIHSGLYYPTASLKARLCVEGNRMLYDLCARHGIPHRPITKLIVAASPEEEGVLDRLLALGAATGVALRRLSAIETRELEPNVRATGGLFSPAPES